MFRKSLLSLALVGLALPLLGGCWLHRARMRAQHRAAHGEPVVKFRWVYYPKANVYHCAHSKWYWHQNKGGKWVRVRKLPGRYRLARLRRHKIRHAATEPWRKHKHHSELRADE